MAIKAFTRKTSGPTSSEEFLKDYENLLKRNRGGGSIVGYDTSSNTPMYLGTSVVDPMGLGQTVSTKTQDSNTSDVSQTVELFNQVLNSLTDNVDTNDVIQVYDFLDNYFNNELPNLTEEQKKQVLPVISNLLNRTGEIINNRSSNADAYQQGMNNPYTPTLPQYANDSAAKENYAGGQGFGLLNYQTNQTADELLKGYTELRDIYKDEYSAKKALLDRMKYSQEYAPLREENKKYNETKQRLIGEGKIDESGRSLDESGRIKLIEGFEYAPDGTVRKVQEETRPNILDSFQNWLGSAKNTTSNAVKNVRGAVGDTIDAVAYSIPGSDKRKDTGFSEWVAGRDTPHTISAAEPETLQAGTGLSRLREDMSYSPSYLASRPDFGEIGLKRAVGNVAGIQDQSALTPKNIVNPSGQDMTGMSRVSKGGVPMSTILPEIKQEPKRQQMSYSMDDLGRIVDAMMSKGYNNRAEAEAVAKADLNRYGNEYMPTGGSSSSNIGVGSNQPQTSYENNSYKSGGKGSSGTSLTYTPRTSSDPMGLANTANIGTPNYIMPTVGVGSNQPSTQSSNQSNGGLMSTISNLLSNLFRRK